MTQEHQILYALEARGGTITTYELLALGIAQYQARIKSLREHLALKGWLLTDAEPILGQKKNFMYRLIKPTNKQMDLIPKIHDPSVETGD